MSFCLCLEAVLLPKTMKKMLKTTNAFLTVTRQVKNSFRVDVRLSLKVHQLKGG